MKYTPVVTRGVRAIRRSYRKAVVKSFVTGEPFNWPYIFKLPEGVPAGKEVGVLDLGKVRLAPARP